jgi:hypothetical protein
LTDKLEALEQKVMATVADARSAVTDTVETVKQSVDRTVQAVTGTVHDTVDSVKTLWTWSVTYSGIRGRCWPAR